MRCPQSEMAQTAVAEEAAPVPQQPVTQGTARPSRRVRLRYIGDLALLVKGRMSRRVYSLRPGTPPLDVDVRDASAFLMSGLFKAEPG